VNPEVSVYSALRFANQTHGIIGHPARRLRRGYRHDHFCVKRRILVGDVGIELHAWFASILRVDVAGRFSAAACSNLDHPKKMSFHHPNLGEVGGIVR